MIPNASMQRAAESLCRRFEQTDYSIGAVVDLVILVANADGKITAEEMSALGGSLRLLLGSGLSEQDVVELVRSSVDVVQKTGVDARIKLIANILVACKAVEEGLRLGFAIGYAHEGLSNDERSIIERIATIAGVPPERVTAIGRETKRAADAEG